MQANQVDATRPDYLNDHTIAIGQDHPRRMFLERTDRDWAFDLKMEIERNQPEVKNLSDFWYVHLALISESLTDAEVCDNVLEEGVRRATGLQHFREEYGILDTYEDGCRCLREMIDSILPNYLIHFRFLEDINSYLVVVDWAQFHPSSFTRQQTQAYCAATYYLCQALNCDFTSIRMGHTLLVECEGVDFHHKQDFKVAKSLWSRLGDLYPINLFQIKYFHPGVFALNNTSDFEHLLPSTLRGQTQVVYESPDHQRLSEINWDSSMGTASGSQRNLQRLEAALKIRYDNDRTFVLEEPEYYMQT